MLKSVKNGTIRFPDTTMDYIRFGRGSKTLVMLPGLGDGLRSMKGTALPMALMYRKYGKDYTVYAFSRKNTLTEGCTTRDMARDQALAMQALGIQKADIFGVSMGGMIAQWLAIDYPELVRKLVLVVTSPCPNPTLTDAVQEWMACALRDDHTALMDNNVRRIYSDRYYRSNKWLVPIMGKLTKPRSYSRFLLQAKACLTHDTLSRLEDIVSPTLVIGGRQDNCLGGEASETIASRIPGAALHMYPQWGHGLYDEAKDFNDIVLGFLRKT